MADSTARPRSSARRGRLAARAIGFGLVLALAATWGSAAGAQFDPSSTLAPTITTVTTTPASSPTSDPVTEATVVPGGIPQPAAADPASKAEEEDRQLLLIVGGLIVVAVALTILTVVYWRHTKPVPLAAPVDDDDLADAPPAIHGVRLGDDAEPEATTDDAESDDETEAATTDPDGATGAAATDGEPGSADTEPEEAGAEAEPGGEPETEAQPEPEAATETATEPEAEAEGPDLAATVAVEAVAVESATDHVGADADWEPHATGEQPIVAASPPSASRVVRPTREQRAAAYAARTQS